jgi:NitT/TauT family transport system substrate-binding protein
MTRYGKSAPSVSTTGPTQSTKRRARSSSTIVVAALVVTSLAVCSSALSKSTGKDTSKSGTTAKALIKVTFDAVSESTQGADVYIAEREGFFKQYGLDVTVVYSLSPPTTALLDGEAQITSGTPVQTYDAQAQGADVVGIYKESSSYEAWVTKDPSITSPRQIKGKTIGVYSLQDPDVIYTAEMAKQFGISSKDYKLLAVGSSNVKLAAVVAGKVPIAPVFPPVDVEAIQQGLHEIFNTTQLTAGQIPVLLLAEQSWAKSNRQTVVDFLAALDKAHQWLFNPANENKGIAIVSQETKIAPDLVKGDWPIFFGQPGKVYSLHGEIDAGTVKNVAQLMLKIGLVTKLVPYAQTVNTTYADAALKMVSSGK